MKNLLETIAYCPIVAACKSSPLSNHPCTKIVSEQSTVSLQSHQLPEPWNGDLEKAKILFLGPNPGIDLSEYYPDRSGSWTPGKVNEFFINRFSEPFTLNKSRPKLKDGSYKEKNKFWGNARNRTAELLMIKSKDVKLGFDFAITEVVHCKSRNQKDFVDLALDTCTELYLEPILEACGAKVIVCFGSTVERKIREEFSVAKDLKISKPVKIGAKDRYFTFLAHPNSNKPKTFSKCLCEEELDFLRGVLTTE